MYQLLQARQRGLIGPSHHQHIIQRSRTQQIQLSTTKEIQSKHEGTIQALE